MSHRVPYLFSVARWSERSLAELSFELRIGDPTSPENHDLPQLFASSLSHCSLSSMPSQQEYESAGAILGHIPRRSEVTMSGPLLSFRCHCFLFGEYPLFLLGLHIPTFMGHYGATNMLNILKNLHKEESGQGLIEFALIALIVALGALIGMGKLASSINNEFSKVSGSLT